MKWSKITERYRGAIVGLSILCVLLAGYMVYRTFAAGKHRPYSYYYTVDDGKTWFPDSADRWPPFDYHGKQAVRIHLFNCGSRIVPGYLQQLTPSAHEALERAKGDEKAMARASLGLYFGIEVKKPGGDKWLSPNTPEGSRIRAVPCSQDVPNPEEVFP